MATLFRGYHTESAGTNIVEVIPAVQNAIPFIQSLSYTSAGTAHTLYVMRCVGTTSTVQGSLSGATTLVINKTDPGKATTGADETLAANDWLVWIDENGVYKSDTVSSLTGSTVTLSNALASDVLSGATVWGFYEVGRATHIQLKPAVSTTTVYQNLSLSSGVPKQTGTNFSRSGVSEPLLVVSSNATAAGSIDYISGYYGAAGNTVEG